MGSGNKNTVELFANNSAHCIWWSMFYSYDLENIMVVGASWYRAVSLQTVLEQYASLKETWMDWFSGTHWKHKNESWEKMIVSTRQWPQHTFWKTQDGACMTSPICWIPLNFFFLHIFLFSQLKKKRLFSDLSTIEPQLFLMSNPNKKVHAKNHFSTHHYNHMPETL